MNILLFCFLALILYCAHYPFLRWSLRSLRCQREFSVSAGFVGQEIRLVETVGNYGSFIIPWLRLESRISPHLRLGSQNNLLVSHDRYFTSLFTLMPHQQIRRIHRVTLLRRGIYDLGSAALTVGDILGFFRCARDQSLSARVMVYPALVEENQLPPLITQQLGELSHQKQLIQDPFLIRGIRDYVPGDPVRDIHWPATAKVGTPQLRLHDDTARTRLLVVLNVQTQAIQWQDRPTEQSEEALEYAISLAATACVRSLEKGLAAGFAANAGLDDNKETTALMPAEGIARIEELLSVFARLSTVRRQYFSSFLESLKSCNDLDILVLSCYEDEDIRSALEQLKRRGNRVTFHKLEGGGPND